MGLSDDKNRGLVPALAAGLVLVYGALSPGAIHSMGYGDEEVAAVDTFWDVVGSWLRLEPAALTPAVTRHGLLTVLLKAPLALVGRMLGTLHPQLAEAPIAFEPILFTTLTVLLLFLWGRELTSTARAWWCAIGAGFCTMLWPYAYIGLETSQSAALIAAGYLALGRGGPEGWRRTALFAAAAAVAVSVKNTGLVLAPAVLYLGVFLVRRVGPGRLERRRHAVFLILVVGMVRALNTFAVLFYTAPEWWVEVLAHHAPNPLAVPLHLLGFLAAPNKGLAVFAPIAVLGLLSVRAAWRAEPRLVTFALLSLGGLALSFGHLLVWSEETWASRYVHSAVAPLVVVFAAAVGRRPVGAVRAWLPVAALALGLFVNSLGVAVYYGSLHVTMTRAGENRLTTLQWDPAWSPVRFHSWVLARWLEAEDAEDLEDLRYVPHHEWWFEPPRDEAPRGAVVGDLVRPQPFLLRFWTDAPPGLDGVAPLLLAALVAGLGLLAWSGRIAHRARR